MRDIDDACARSSICDDQHSRVLYKVCSSMCIRVTSENDPHLKFGDRRVLPRLERRPGRSHLCPLGRHERGNASSCGNRFGCIGATPAHVVHQSIGACMPRD